jgi:hypothetical protein
VWINNSFLVITVHVFETISVRFKGPPGKTSILVQKRCHSEDSTDDNDDDWSPPVSKRQKRNTSKCFPAAKS